MSYASQMKHPKTNILEVIKNKIKRQSVVYVINKNGCYCIYQGQKLTCKQLDLILPIEIKKVRWNGDNPDSTKSYL